MLYVWLAPVRSEYPSAIYYVLSSGSGEQAISHIEGGCRWVVDGLEETVGRTRWEVLASVWMPNHIRFCLRTLNPSL